jgi:hypothetical protein
MNAKEVNMGIMGQIHIKRRRPVKLLIAFTITAALVVFLSSVFLSPLALRDIDHLRNVNWKELSYVGQTYGAISALLAATALTGVVVSINLQIRDSRAERWAETRARHYELMRMALDEPLYMSAFSWPDITDESKRLGVYINLLLSLWETQWEFGDIPERQLRQHLAGALSTRAGREYWANAGTDRRRYDSNTRRQREFNRIAEEVYSETVALGGRPAATMPSAVGRSKRGAGVFCILIALVAAALALLRRLQNFSRRL